MRSRLNRSRWDDVLRAIGTLTDKLRPRGGSRSSPPAPPGRRPEPPASHGPALPDTRLGDVDVSYEPCLDGDPDPGEVVWAWVPYEENPAEGKDRPVVVIGRRGPLLAAVALTTKGANHGDHDVFVGSGAWDPQRRDSWARLDRVLQVDPAAVRREGAVLDKARFEAVIDALRTHTHHGGHR